MRGWRVKSLCVIEMILIMYMDLNKDPSVIQPLRIILNSDILELNIKQELRWEPFKYPGNFYLQVSY